jgi:endonuclease-3 related protein
LKPIRAHPGPEGPFVGTPPPARAPRRWAHDERLDALLRELAQRYGPQHWWPARTPWEVCVGAVLVQHTAWRNVERALANLRRARLTSPARLLAADEGELGRALAPSGTWRVKRARLLALARWCREAGGLAALRAPPLERARATLLAVHGIGPETADAILCYAVGRRTVVMDAYARRLLEARGLVPAGRPLALLRRHVAERLVRSQWVHEEFHALCVRAGRDRARATQLLQRRPGPWIGEPSTV